MSETKERKYSLPIREWPEDDRPREKLIARGAAEMTEVELLAIILRTGEGTGGKSAVDQAREMITTFGSLHAIEKAGVGELCRAPGIGPAKAATVKAALELGRRLAARPQGKPAQVTSPEDVYNIFRSRLENLDKETFWALLLDLRGKVIKEARISEGILTETLVHPREVFSQAIREGAARVIFVHNHPSGDTTPSREDKNLQKRLEEAGELLGIPVLDHIIIGKNGYSCVETSERDDEKSVAADR